RAAPPRGLRAYPTRRSSDLPDLAAEEALALDGLLFTSRRKPVLPGTTLRVALSHFEAALRSCAIDPRAEYERVGGRSLRDLPARSESTRLNSSHLVISYAAF